MLHFDRRIACRLRTGRAECLPQFVFVDVDADQPRTVCRTVSGHRILIQLVCAWRERFESAVPLVSGFQRRRFCNVATGKMDRQFRAFGRLFHKPLFGDGTCNTGCW